MCRKPASYKGLSYGAGTGGRTPMTRRSADFEGIEAIYFRLLWSAFECVGRDSDEGAN
jgi:hypothetical protein